MHESEITEIAMQNATHVLELFQNNSAIDYLLSKRRGTLTAMTLPVEAMLIASAFRKQKKPMFVVKKNLYQAQRLYSQMMQLLKEEEVVFFGVDESMRVEAVATSPEMSATRNESMARLMHQTDGLLCITHTAAVVRHLPSPKTYRKHTLFLEKEQRVSMNDLRELLYQAGYQIQSKADQPMTFAVRGGIVDVFALNHENPIRIEFFDDEIENIRYFDATSQRTISYIDEVYISPASEVLFSQDEATLIRKKANDMLEKEKKRLAQSEYEELAGHVAQEMDLLESSISDQRLYKYMSWLPETSNILQYQNNPLVIVSTQEEVLQSYQTLMEETLGYMNELNEDHKSLLIVELFHDIRNILANVSSIAIKSFRETKEDIVVSMRPVAWLAATFVSMMELVIKKAENRKLLLCLTNEIERKQVINFVAENSNLTMLSVDQFTTAEHGIRLINIGFEEGFESEEEGIVVLTAKELFQKRPRIARYANKFKEAEVLKTHQELHAGDYIVHEQYGVGQYSGIVMREIEGVHKDFLQVVYKGNDVLLVPLEQFSLIRKFTGKEGVAVKTHKLGTNEWEKAKRKISERVDDLAQRLVELYALREGKIGYAFSKDNELQAEFDQAFEFELTKDQEIAVAEIKKDMESPKPMDRLLCGDVGFGKTEVAIRAAFKAVLDNKQVAFLCPTTILSLQHYKTIMTRCKDYPVRIALINRFVMPATQKEIIRKLKNKEIDILIGTHRLLSKDVQFADLGLLVIDEEQRFGVEHKEKIKELKASIDVLSLSATPIPRTLQMSLVGIRSLSQLDTPPKNRMPVQTYVIEKNNMVIKEIIERELSRDGQVFYLFNRVSQIFQVAAKIEQDIPGCRVGVAHGKMTREEIEDVMMRFTENEFQVLVCTTIIETGIDIPNANTMIIEDADRFGLSQLYQIKGRVGRSDRLAYAYLLYRPNKVLNEIAMKRLQSIKEFTELGSGYKIAMRDLTIRGAGDMLGPEQAGFIDTVGIDMYIEMLHEAIKRHQGISVEEIAPLQKINVSVDAYLPGSFVNEDLQKITMYQRIDKVQSTAQLADYIEEVRDMYGSLPKAVELLFRKKTLEILVNEPRVEEFKETKQGMSITFTKEYSQTLDGIKLFELISSISKDMKLTYAKNQITIQIAKSPQTLHLAISVLEKTNEIDITKIC